jgi:hypothetical protein
LLAGYVLQWQGKVAEADEVFTTVVPHVPQQLRCEMTDLRRLLPVGYDSVYRKVPCAARDSINARIWWLSDPLYTEPGNERRAAHYARHVQVQLLSAVEENDPFDWAPEYGGAAIRQMFVRYGAPAAQVWVDEDGSHQGYLGAYRPVHFTTNEYTFDRLHVVPNSAALADPFRAIAADWTLTAEAFVANGAPTRTWWPNEHYARDVGRLMQLVDYQFAMFRRDDNVLLGVAANPYATDSTLPRLTQRGSLVFSTGPDAMLRHPLETGLLGSMVGVVPATVRPQLLSVELGASDTQERVAGRTRFGLVTPEPLSRLTPGSVAISDVALLVGDPRGLPNEPAAALKRMYGTFVLDQPSRIGLYWETYGIAPTDSIEVSIRIENLDRPGTVRRIAQSLGLAARTERSIVYGWRDSRAIANTTLIPGRVPALGRTLQLDVSSLVPGHYRLTVTVNRPGETPVATSRDLVM